MKAYLLHCRFTLRKLFVIVFGLGLISAWVSYNYRIVQQRKDYWPQFNDHDFSVRTADVYEIGEGKLIIFPRVDVPWIRDLLGDRPQFHLIYDPRKDPTGSELRQTRELFPEAKYWPWPNIENVPEGMERLTDQHYVRI